MNVLKGLVYIFYISYIEYWKGWWKLGKVAFPKNPLKFIFNATFLFALPGIFIYIGLWTLSHGLNSGDIFQLGLGAFLILASQLYLPISSEELVLSNSILLTIWERKARKNK